MSEPSEIPDEFAAIVRESNKIIVALLSGQLSPSEARTLIAAQRQIIDGCELIIKLLQQRAHE